MAESVFFETDVFGTESNVKALARFIDAETDTTNFVGEIDVAYCDGELDTVEDIIKDMEDKAIEIGYTVEWSNGVFIYNTADLDLEEDTEI